MSARSSHHHVQLAADEDSQYVANHMRQSLEDVTGRKFAYDQFAAVAYKTQPGVVDDATSGTYLFVKINTGNGDCIHIKVYWPMRDSRQDVLELHSYQLDKTMADPIEPDSFTPMMAESTAAAATSATPSNNIIRVVIQKLIPLESAPIQAAHAVMVAHAIPDTDYSPSQPNYALQERLTSVKPAVEKQAGRTFPEFTAVLYLKKTTRYAVKVCVGKEEFIHVGLRYSSGQTKVKYVQLNKTEKDLLSLQE